MLKVTEHRPMNNEYASSRISKLSPVNLTAVGSADLKISKSALLSLNHHNFSNTKPIYTE